MKRGRSKMVIVLITIVAIISFINTITFSQCAMCKTTIESSPQGQKMAKNFNNAILFLLSAPYLVFGTTAYILYKKKHSKITPNKISVK